MTTSEEGEKVTKWQKKNRKESLVGLDFSCSKTKFDLSKYMHIEKFQARWYSATNNIP